MYPRYFTFPPPAVESERRRLRPQSAWDGGARSGWRRELMKTNGSVVRSQPDNGSTGAGADVCSSLCLTRTEVRTSGGAAVGPLRPARVLRKARQVGSGRCAARRRRQLGEQTKTTTDDHKAKPRPFTQRATTTKKEAGTGQEGQGERGGGWRAHTHTTREAGQGEGEPGMALEVWGGVKGGGWRIRSSSGTTRRAGCGT